MDRAAALAAFDEQLRETVWPGLGVGRLERVGNMIRCVSPWPDGWNGIDWSDLASSTADAAIAEQVAYFTGLVGGSSGSTTPTTNRTTCPTGCARPGSSPARRRP
ncbi:hypothetical protein [Actinophytocola sp.]|uniref:hypothetical protein n=1 Tax=Actinophytocola sp. TaxID=1872138 RepID=UPI003D6B1A35